MVDASRPTPPAPMAPPVPKRVPHVRSFHGVDTPDDRYWLLDRDDPDTIAHLEAENAYTEAVLAPLGNLQEQIFQEIKARVLETDLSVPSRRGPWWYLTRTTEGSQYPVLCRRPAATDTFGGDEAAEQVLLDGNQLAGDSPYFGFGLVDISADHRIVAYSTDHEGDETYTLRFRDLTTGTDLPDVIEGTSYGSAWAADGSAFFYTTIDDAYRPHRVWRHTLGTPSTEDVLVVQEDDDRFFVSLGLTRSKAFVVISIDSKITSEVRLIPADQPTAEPQVVLPRREGIEYTVEHHGDRFLILTNDGHPDFGLFHAPIDDPAPHRWTPLWTPGQGTRLTDVDAFAGHVVVHHRIGGDEAVGTAVRIYTGDLDQPEPEHHDIAFDEAVYTVELADNPDYEAGSLRISYESMVTPPTIYDYEVATRTLVLRKQQPVLGGYESDDYQQRRVWATAPDGERIPVSVVHRADTPLDGTAPCLLYGYGSYEVSIDPYFSTLRLPLLDRGFVFAIAHIRGGGERGRRWYESGKLLAKRNTFTDFVAVARHLCDEGYTSPAKLAARGGSAGGLLMGAVANLAPDLFAAIVAEVPFVDALNTILDPSLPLTVTEWEEWGNPIESAEVFEYMRSYTPYENIRPEPYPAMLVTAGLNDPRVGYHEPAKWVARLREVTTGDRPIVLKTEMGAGHGGPSGRYDAWREQALVTAFLVEHCS